MHLASIGVVVAALLASVAVSSGDRDRHWRWCSGGPGVSTEQVIAGCTEIIINPSGESDKDLAVAHHNRGLALDLRNEHDRAIQDFDEAIRLRPDYAQAYFGRGVAYFFKGEYDRSIKDYDEAIRLKADYAEAF